MKTRKNNYVYSIQITKEQRELLKKSETIKKDLDKYVRDYLNSFFNEDASGDNIDIKS